MSAIGKLQIHRPKASDKTPFQPVSRPFAPASAARRGSVEMSPQPREPFPQPSVAVPSGFAVGELTLQTKGDGAGSREEASAAQRPNKTGMPDDLKTGIESLSGMSLDNVQVHYNSARPVQLNALAYAQGSDIQVAPGQEQHLPHEAWHIVQQAQGRVKPTMQMKDGVPVNDDAGLEHEADVMGAEALAPGSSFSAVYGRGDAAGSRRGLPDQPPSGAARTGVVQGKFGFADTDRFPPRGVEAIHEMAKLMHQKALSAIRANKELLVGISGQEAYDEILSELTRELAFCNNIYSLVTSPVDYGVVNLDNPQHVAQFFRDAGRFLNKNFLEQEKNEGKEEKERQLAQSAWLELKQSAPEPDKAYQTAVLGTGASVAYYLNAKGGDLDPQTTVLIGNRQPWDPQNKDSGRGIGFVNHPMHMTSPRRAQTQLPEQSGGSDEAFKDNARILTEDIDKTLSAFGRPVDAKISLVKKREEEKHRGWYQIETSSGNYYARKVVSGLGIGPHAAPRNALAGKINSSEQKDEEKKRVMDLDTFQRQLKDPNSFVMAERQRRGNLIIGVAGPNAGVDAVYEATNLGMVVAWVVSGGPAIAEGMGNKISRKGLVDLHFDYLNGWTVSGQLINMDLSGKWRGNTPAEDQKKAEKEFLEKNPGWDISEKKQVLANFLVYAQGPDVQKIWNVFAPNVTKDLALRGDSEGRFGAHEGADFWQGSVETSLRSATYNIYWESIFNRVAEVLPGEASKWQKTRDAIRDEVLKILGIIDFKRIEQAKIGGVGLETEDGSLEIIGGSAIRILDYLDSQKARHDKTVQDANNKPLEEVKLLEEAQKILEKIPEKLRSGDTGAKMREVIKTLSSPTILNTDQLTPIRSQIEAMSDYMPGYIGGEESNFVTDDQDMIAAQIAGWYGNIPEALANYVTQMIIEDRNKQGVRPGTSGGGRAFVEKWKGKLEALHNLFASAHIKEIASGW